MEGPILKQKMTRGSAALDPVDGSMLIFGGHDITTGDNFDVIQKLPNTPNAEWDLEDLKVHSKVFG